MRNAWSFATACLILPLAAAGASAQTAPLTIQGAGATFPAPLYKQWAASYHSANPTVRINYESVGSGEGVTRFRAGTVDFGASDRPLSSAEMDAMPRSGMMVPATAGMVVIAYNLPGVTGELKLARDVYADIFAGKITNWNDIRVQAANPDIKLPRRAIALVARADGSGTTFAFTNHLASVRPDWRDNGPGVGTTARWPVGTFLARGNEGVSHTLKISEGAIGYVEYGFAKRLGLAVASLQNKSGAFVRPSDQTAQPGLTEALRNPQFTAPDPTAADAYPIVTYSWLLLYRAYADVAKRDALKAFVAWSLNDGQKLGGPLGYVALPAEVAQRSRDSLAEIR